jgi:hypothetical protein
MDIKISEDRLNEISFPILDEVYGILNTPDKTRFYDESGEGRILIRKNQPHIYFKDYRKLSSIMDLQPHIWGIVIKNWLKQNFGINVKPEFVWMSWTI